MQISDDIAEGGTSAWRYGGAAGLVRIEARVGEPPLVTKAEHALPGTASLATPGGAALAVLPRTGLVRSPGLSIEPRE